MRFGRTLGRATRKPFLATPKSATSLPDGFAASFPFPIHPDSFTMGSDPEERARPILPGGMKPPAATSGRQEPYLRIRGDNTKSPWTSSIN
jgi:hypothetical protein